MTVVEVAIVKVASMDEDKAVVKEDVVEVCLS